MNCSMYGNEMAKPIYLMAFLIPLAKYTFFTSFSSDGIKKTSKRKAFVELGSIYRHNLQPLYSIVYTCVSGSTGIHSVLLTCSSALLCMLCVRANQKSLGLAVAEVE